MIEAIKLYVGVVGWLAMAGGVTLVLFGVLWLLGDLLWRGVGLLIELWEAFRE